MDLCYKNAKSLEFSTNSKLYIRVYTPCILICATLKTVVYSYQLLMIYKHLRYINIIVYESVFMMLTADQHFQSKCWLGLLLYSVFWVVPH